MSSVIPALEHLWLSRRKHLDLSPLDFSVHCSERLRTRIVLQKEISLEAGNDIVESCPVVVNLDPWPSGAEFEGTPDQEQSDWLRPISGFMQSRCCNGSRKLTEDGIRLYVYSWQRNQWLTYPSVGCEDLLRSGSSRPPSGRAENKHNEESCGESEVSRKRL